MAILTLNLHHRFRVAVGEGAWFLSALSKDYEWALISLARVVIQTVIFYFTLKLRATVGRLADKDFDKFLVETLFKEGFQTVASVLFVVFRFVKCIVESGLDNCSANVQCAVYISLFLATWWLLKLVQGSIEAEWRHRLSLSMSKIAKGKIGLRRAAEGGKG